MFVKLVLIALCVGHQYAKVTDAHSVYTEAKVESDETSFMQLQLKLHNKMPPKAEWQEPLTTEEAAVFEKDMRMPIIQWQKENPSLNSDYFAYFGYAQGYQELLLWQGVHNVTDYAASGKESAGMWKDWDGYYGENKGPSATWSIEGEVVTSRHLDHFSYLADDAYCYSFGWLKGQGLTGIENDTAWEALAVQECKKIGDALSVDFPIENHTVVRHVMWNRVWPQALNCNVLDGPEDFGVFPAVVDCDVVDCNLRYNSSSPTCIPMTKNNLREHVFRKCMFGFPAPEMAYCYSRGCLINGNEIGHGPECS